MNRKPVLSIPLALIDVPNRLRELDPDWAALLAESFRERGQDTPIWVSQGDEKTGRHRLIAGMHRLEAARLAGWDAIGALAFEGTDLQAELLEIDENLIRRELSELDRATFLSRRKEVWEALHPHTKHGGRRRGDQVANPGHSVAEALAHRFSAEAAEKLGMSERSVRRAIKRHSGLAPDVRRLLANTPFAHRGTELDALAKLPVQDQRRVVAELVREVQPAGSVREARITLGMINPPQQAEAERQFNALLTAWRKAGRTARDQFLAHLERAARTAQEPSGEGEGKA